MVDPLAVAIRIQVEVVNRDLAVKRAPVDLAQTGLGENLSRFSST